MKDEEQKVSKMEVEEEVVMKNWIETHTAEAVAVHEKQLSLVIGRLLARQARKLATPTASLDPMVIKFEVGLARLLDSMIVVGLLVIYCEM